MLFLDYFNYIPKQWSNAQHFNISANIYSTSTFWSPKYLSSLWLWDIAGLLKAKVLLTVLKGLRMLKQNCHSNFTKMPPPFEKHIQIHNAALVTTLWFPFAVREESKM